MHAARATLAWTVMAVALLAALVAWTRFERPEDSVEGMAVFSRHWRGCEIVMPNSPTPEERRAAQWLARVFAQAAGVDVTAFPVVTEAGRFGRRGVFVGATSRAQGEWTDSQRAPFDTGVSYRVEPGALIISSEARASIEVAAAWFAEQVLAAQWFMPGDRGAEMPRRDALILACGRLSARPAFLSRDLSGVTRPEERAWYVANGFERRIGHGHSYNTVFSPEVLRTHPEFAPVINGEKYFPVGRDYEWQPNIANPAAAEHAADVIDAAFASESKRLWYPLCINDSMRFDTSAETQERVLPLKFFRGRPDFSDLVFRFTNDVARRVAQNHPDRFISAYAYYWTENAPSFRVEPNVVPVLTADRSQWFDATFAAEDQRLIERWCASGAKVVGVYDYFYGAPFLVPRPTLYAVKESIPFEYRAGVRAFFAEAQPNWALDGPKLWLAAKLLWDPAREPDAWLDIYYREFWRESAAPMRRFFDLAEDAWRKQAGPAYWLKFYGDEHQTVLYPAERLAAMRACLDEAARLAHAARVQARVRFVDAGFRVSEAFAAACAQRDRVWWQTDDANVTPDALLTEWRAWHEAREQLQQVHAELLKKEPLALRQLTLKRMLRSDPSARVAWRLREQGAIARASEVEATLGATGEPTGEERLRDANWSELIVRRPAPAFAMRWTAMENAWVGVSEPAEGRRVVGEPTATGGKRLRYTNCLQEALRQVVPVAPGAVCSATVSVRAKVSAGNETSLGVSFLDAQGQTVGGAWTDRVPIGETRSAVTLHVLARAPKGAVQAVFGLAVTHQVDGDFAEFEAASLKIAQ